VAIARFLPGGILGPIRGLLGRARSTPRAPESAKA
jgi:hypothetical protein